MRNMFLRPQNCKQRMRALKSAFVGHVVIYSKPFTAPRSPYSRNPPLSSGEHDCPASTGSAPSECTSKPCGKLSTGLQLQGPTVLGLRPGYLQSHRHRSHLHLTLHLRLQRSHLVPSTRLQPPSQRSALRVPNGES